MIISFFIDNFAGYSEKTFSFLENDDVLFAIHTDTIQTQSYIGLQDNNFFFTLSFLQNLIIHEKNSLLARENEQYRILIKDIATFKLTFRIFGNNYEYIIKLSQQEIIQEELYQFDSFSFDNLGKIELGKRIFKRTQESFIGDVKPFSLASDRLLISCYADKKTAPPAYYQTYAYFKKELFIFTDRDFLSFMGERAIPENGKNLLEQLTITGKTLLPFFPVQNEIIPSFYYQIRFSEKTIQFFDKSTLQMHGEIAHQLTSENLQKFFSTLYAMHSEIYRIFCVNKINAYLNPITFFLLKEVFLLERDTKFNQLFFTVT